MPPRPLHRWKSFWLGILVLAFLGCGWVHSMSHTDGFFWLPKHFSISAYQSTGQLGFSWDASQTSTSLTYFHWIHEPISTAGEPWFPRAVVPEIYDRQFQFGIAHWFLMLLFLSAWIAFLVWRIRRQSAPGNGE
ncbi:hypothetical protein [Luteolibacter soli]|uniref:DUF3592 domain-containing protein n=1 Tax=Luteolibacter soli TaxID=3135280 RepID=A0ABU9B427_9BACT